MSIVGGRLGSVVGSHGRMISGGLMSDGKMSDVDECLMKV